MTLPASSTYAGVTTLEAHVERAVEFQARDDVWFMFGKTSVWDGIGISDVNPPSPPDPNVRLADLTEKVVIAKASLYLVVPDALGTLRAYGRNYRVVAPGDAQDEGAREVLATCRFEYNAGPIRNTDSYLTATANIGVTNITVADASGYLVGDNLLVGPAGQQLSILSIAGNVLSLSGPLTAVHYAGEYITNLSTGTILSFRQTGILTGVDVDLGAPGQVVAPFANVNSAALYYYANYPPVPQQLNFVREPRIVLTF